MDLNCAIYTYYVGMHLEIGLKPERCHLGDVIERHYSHLPDLLYHSPQPR